MNDCFSNHDISSYEKIYCKDIDDIIQVIKLIYKCIHCGFDKYLCNDFIERYIHNFHIDNKNRWWSPENWIYCIIFNKDETIDFRAITTYVYYKLWPTYIIESHNLFNIKVLDFGCDKLIESMLVGLQESNRLDLIEHLLTVPLSK